MIKPRIFKSIPNLLAAQSTRQDGVSPPPYSSLNLGINTADEWAHIEQNRANFTRQIEINWSQVAYAKQIHGSEILHVQEPGLYEGYDALVSDVAGLYVAMATADCAAILMYDPKKRVSAAVHAGWRGASAQIVSKTLIFMKQKFRSNPAHCLVYVGPCIGAAAFEIGAEVAVQFDSIFLNKIENSAKYCLDLKAALYAELLLAGVQKEHIEIDKNCTFSNTTDFFSHRKENGLTGRMLGLIGLSS